VNGLLDRLRDEQPRLYGMLLYVEQPFPYELEAYPIDVHSVSARKPLFLDESAHNWRLVQRGRSLGWTGVALKTCKTQTGALLAACWARAHGMALMVQDLTNPMLAQIPHCLLAAHTGTIMGVETNAMQFYPEASRAEAEVHPGLYRRRHGEVDLSTVAGPGFGYRLEEIHRVLPPPAAACENTGGGEPVRPDILWSRRPPRAVDPEDKPILTMSTLPPLILASASPRRAELLKQIGLEFGQLPTHVPEEQPEHLTPAEICQINSYHKARALAKKHPDALVLGADTLVCLGTRIFGKPASLAVAEEMLLELQGQEHQVITGVCLIHLRAHRQRLFAEGTTVRFHRLSLTQVRVYLSRIDPLDKAGAYAIQEHGELIVERIDGSFSNVVGLPVERLQEVLAAWPREQAPSP
jgi:MAF protein